MKRRDREQLTICTELPSPCRLLAAFTIALALFVGQRMSVDNAVSAVDGDHRALQSSEQHTEAELDGAKDQIADLNDEHNAKDFHLTSDMIALLKKVLINVANDKEINSTADNTELAEHSDDDSKTTANNSEQSEVSEDSEDEAGIAADAEAKVEAQGTELLNANGQITELNEELKDANELVAELTEEHDADHAKLKDAEAQIEELNEELDADDAEVEMADEQIEELEKDRENAEERIEELNEELDADNAQMQEADEQVGQLGEELDTDIASLTGARDQVAELQNELNSGSNELNGAEDQITAPNDEHEDVNVPVEKEHIDDWVQDNMLDNDEQENVYPPPRK